MELEGGEDSFYPGYGRPVNGRLRLSLVEAAYLIHRGKLQVEGLDFQGYLKKVSVSSGFEIKYLVYRDLRERGYHVQPGVTDFRVYPRGGGPGKTKAKYLVHAISERAPLPLSRLEEDLETAGNLKKRFILATVDEESDITYYEIKKADPRGEGVLPPRRERATLLEDRVIIWDSLLPYREGFYGRPLDENHLQVSLVEAGYLLKKGLLELEDTSGRKLDPQEFTVRSSQVEAEFPLKLQVYQDLRERGLTVKTGFKFGSHFRVYKKAGSKLHSNYLVHAIPPDFTFSLPGLSSSVRLAQSVHKHMLFAKPEGDEGVKYLEVVRIKP